MKKFIYILWQIFLRVFLIPLLLSLGIYTTINIFIGPFLILLSLNFILGQIFNLIMSERHRKQQALLDEKFLELQKNQTIQVPCAYCNAKNTVPLNLAVGSFVCNNCKNENRLLLNFRTARITTPVKSDILEEVPTSETYVTIGTV